MNREKRVSACLSIFFTVVALGGCPTTGFAGTDSHIAFELPVVPLELSVNSDGALSLAVVPSCVTPIGKFSLGLGANNVPEAKAPATYFILRSQSAEDVYCLGTGGILSLTTDGKSKVNISTAAGHSNVFYLDVKEAKGKFTVDFIPDPVQGALAEFGRAGGSSLSIRNDGSIDVKSGDSMKHIPLEHIYGLDFAKLRDGGVQAEISYFDKGGLLEHVFSGGVAKESVPQLRWFCSTFKRVSPERYHETEERWMGPHASEWDDGNIAGAAVFYDGSVEYLGSLINSFYIPGDMITDVQKRGEVVVLTITKKRTIHNIFAANEVSDKVELNCHSKELADDLVRFEWEVLYSRKNNHNK